MVVEEQDRKSVQSERIKKLLADADDMVTEIEGRMDQLRAVEIPPSRQNTELWQVVQLTDKYEKLKIKIDQAIAPA